MIYKTSSKRIFERDSLLILFGAFCWAAVVCIFVWPANYFFGVDAYYHIKIAEIMSQTGFWLQGFPWADCSIWKEHFFDKDWLFHIYLIPFLKLGNIPGGKIAILTAVFLSGLSWGLLLKNLKVKNLLLFLLLMISSYGFLSRMTMCRGHLISLIFLPLCLIFLVKRKKILLLVFTFLYMLSYAGAWQILPIAVFFDFIYFYKSREKSGLFNLNSFYVLIGILLSIFINPYFPDNIYGLFVQNYIVLKTKWFGVKDIVFKLGNELNPMTDRKLFMHYFIYIFLLIVTWGNFLKNYKKMNYMNIFFFLLSVIYFCLSILSTRFSEYSVPVGFVFIGLFWNNWLNIKKENSLKFKVTLNILTVLLLFFIFCLSFKYSTIIRNYQPPKYINAAKWLNGKAEKSFNINDAKYGKIVFTCDWASSPILFYYAPRYRYLVFLDPCFMYAYSPEKYKIWYKITEGKALTPVEDIKKYFNAEYIFVTKHNKNLEDELAVNPLVELVYRGSNFEKIYKIK